jgi:hypothetical protein
MHCKHGSLLEKQLEAENGKAHDGQCSKWDGPDVSAIEKQKHIHPPGHDGDAYLRKGKIGRVHAYSACGGGVSSCDSPLRKNGKKRLSIFGEFLNRDEIF